MNSELVANTTSTEDGRHSLKAQWALNKKLFRKALQRQHYCKCKTSAQQQHEMGDRTRAKWAEKWRLLCPFLWGELTRPTSVPGGILTHPAVWPQ